MGRYQWPEQVAKPSGPAGAALCPQKRKVFSPVMGMGVLRQTVGVMARRALQKVGVWDQHDFRSMRGCLMVMPVKARYSKSAKSTGRKVGLRVEPLA